MIHRYFNLYNFFKIATIVSLISAPSLLAEKKTSKIQTFCISKDGTVANWTLPLCKNSIPIDIYTPEKTKIVADVLVLNGWSYPRDDWQKKTRILKSANENGFRLIFPEMGKSNYASEFYAETTLKWSTMPGGKWVREILIPTLQKNGILGLGGKNFVMGLSTGGRGAAILGLTKSDLFSGAASISGDFDQTSMPKDRLMTGSYGKYEENKERWEKIDNIFNNAKDWKIPIYLGHGQSDKVVPFSQTKNFYLKLKTLHPNLKVVLNDPKNAEHNYKYWDSEVDPIFQFFSEIK